MKVICEECRDYVEYYKNTDKKIKIIKGEKIEVEIELAYCKQCGELVYVPEIEDHNLKVLQIAYRKKLDLISIEEISEILKKYDIGKRPLSILLDWGEVTITRYLDGSLPTKQYSDILKQIHNDPNEMLKALNKNKDKISDVAYKKCLNKLETLIGKDSANYDMSFSKIDDVIKYILFLSDDITPLALQKILYYCQGFYKSFCGEELFFDYCEAWIHGPVYPNVYYKFRENGYRVIEKEIEVSTIKLTKIEKELIYQIVNSFGCYSGKVLENMTHSEKPWREARLNLEDNMPSKEKINKNVIYQYFMDIKAKYNMLNIEDIKDYAADLFPKVHMKL
ncbi:MAG TPA: hypothetical protein DCY20_11900 [Firmicutes bacterium]|nr:hypothetical protein [Bacillota bacterium]